MVLGTRVSTQAPGKLILMGEHAAVYGRPALVAGLGLVTRVVLSSRLDQKVRLILPDVEVDEMTDWEAIAAYGEMARQAWKGYVRQPSAEALAELRGADPAHVVKVALAETLATLGAAPPGLDVEVESELPVGAGFGSSASVSVAVIGALLALAWRNVDRELADCIALEAERRQHGSPSGVDHGAVLYGGVQWVQRASDGSLERQRLVLPPKALDGLAIFDTGTPAETTGEVVETVRMLYEDRLEELEEILDGMETQVGALRDLLTDPQPRDGLAGLLSGFESGLETLGVVPEAVREVIREIESSGWGAKISGAGALSGTAAGSLLVAQPGEDSEELAGLVPFRRVDAELGVPGLRVELEN